MISHVNFNPRHSHNNFHSNIPNASPSLISICQSDLRIVIDDIPDYSDHITTSNPTKDPAYIITKMIEEIRVATRKKKVNGSLYEYYTCHSCRSVLEKKFLIHCTDKECLRYFCLRCTNKRYGFTAEDIYEIMKLEEWNCFSCRGMCVCKICQERFLGTVETFPDLLFGAENVRTLPVEQLLAGQGDMEGVIEQENRKTGKNRDPSKNKKTKKDNEASKENMLGIECKIEDDGEMMNKIKSDRARNLKLNDLNKQKVKVKDECHICNARLSPDKLVMCSLKYCKSQFCVPCIQASFLKDFNLESYSPSSWTCYSCTGVCRCLPCLKKRRNARDKNMMKNVILESKLFLLNKSSQKQPHRPDGWFSNQSNAPPIRKCLILEDQSFGTKSEDQDDSGKMTCSTTSQKDFMIKKKSKDVIVLDKKDIDDSKIISEFNIDSACITLYDAETEEQLKDDLQRKLGS